MKGSFGAILAKITKKHYIAGLIIGGSFLIGCFFFFLYQYQAVDSLSKYVSSEALLYFQIKPSVFRKLREPSDEKYASTLSSIIDNAMTWDINFEKHVLPYISRDFALVVVDENNPLPVLLARTRSVSDLKNVLQRQKLFLINDSIVAISPHDIDFPRFFGNMGSDSLYFSALSPHFGYAYIKIVVNMNTLFPHLNEDYQRKFSRADYVVAEIHSLKDPIPLTVHSKDEGVFSHDAFIPSASDALPPVNTRRRADVSVFDGNMEYFASSYAAGFLRESSYRRLINDVLPKLDENFNAFVSLPTNDEEDAEYSLSFRIRDEFKKSDVIKEIQNFLALELPETVIRLLPDKSTVTEEIFTPYNTLFVLEDIDMNMYSIRRNNAILGYVRFFGNGLIFSTAMSGSSYDNEKISPDTTCPRHTGGPRIQMSLRLIEDYLKTVVSHKEFNIFLENAINNTDVQIILEPQITPNILKGCVL